MKNFEIKQSANQLLQIFSKIKIAQLITGKIKYLQDKILYISHLSQLMLK